MVVARTDGTQACAELPDEFVPTYLSRRAPAYIKKICNACPFRNECLQEAIVNRAHGYWAGTSDFERTGARRR